MSSVQESLKENFVLLIESAELRSSSLPSFIGIIFLLPFQVVNRLVITSFIDVLMCALLCLF